MRMGGGRFAAKTGEFVRRVPAVADLAGFHHPAKIIILQIHVPVPGRISQFQRHLMESPIQLEKCRWDRIFEVFSIL